MKKYEYVLARAHLGRGKRHTRTKRHHLFLRAFLSFASSSSPSGSVACPFCHARLERVDLRPALSPVAIVVSHACFECSVHLRHIRPRGIVDSVVRERKSPHLDNAAHIKEETDSRRMLASAHPDRSIIASTRSSPVAQTEAIFAGTR